MPKEKFYPSYAVEGEPSPLLEIAWQRTVPGVWMSMIIGDTYTEFEVDRSAINRLIQTLRKARDQTHGADE